MRPIYAIYVEEQLIDIDPKTIVALTLQASDFGSGDIISRKASYTNQIKVPATKTNIVIFQYANNPKSGSAFPYLTKTVKILCNGVQILDGVVFIASFDTYFNLQIFSVGKDLSASIANLYLSDLNFGDSPITWNAAFIDSKRASTSGWCAPVVSYGQIDISGGGNLSIGAWYPPSVSYKDTLTALFTNAGYTVSGTFYTSDVAFNNTVILYSREDFVSTTVKLNEVLPTTLLQSDFLKDFMIKFGVVFIFTGNAIEILTYESIINNIGASVDWTNKRVKNKKDVLQFTWGNYAMKNNFLYDDISNLPDGFSVTGNNIVNGSLDIPNSNLSQTNDLYSSIFAQTNYIGLSRDRVEGTGANFVNCSTSLIWNVLPSSYTFDNVPVMQLAVLSAKDAGEVAVVYNGSARTDYKVARFNPSTAVVVTPQSLAWSGTTFHSPGRGLLDTYYPSIQRLFTNGIKVGTHEYYLTDMDIYALDLLTLVYDDGNYYLINKVPSFVSGRTTRVELLQLS